MAGLLADLTGRRADGCISITVKAMPGGKVSKHLVRRATPGTLVHLDQAAGEFVLPDRVATKLLFVTAGSGITPVIGHAAQPLPGRRLRRRPAALECRHDITVVHVAPSEPDSIFVADLRALDDAGLIRLVARYTDEHGVLDVDERRDLVPDLPSATTLACGPTGLLDALETHRERATASTAAHRAVPGATVAAPARAAPVTFGQ